MIIILNGPLGAGKSTLAEALAESIDQCVMLDGDQLIAANPPASDQIEHLHSTLVLLVAHHRQFGYRHFVIDHIWKSPADLSDLRLRLREVDPDAEIRCFLLTLSLEQNLRRIQRRQAVRPSDEHDIEWRTVLAERQALARQPLGQLGEPFDVTAPPWELVAALLRRAGLEPAAHQVPIRIADAVSLLESQLVAEGLDPEGLEPWEAWKAFKRFLATPVETDDEGASVQFVWDEIAEGEFRVYLEWIRQFVVVEGNEDIPYRYVGIELSYRTKDLPLERDLQVWSYDFPSLAAFASHVEGLADFQRAMNVGPVTTQVISGEI